MLTFQNIQNDFQTACILFILSLVLCKIWGGKGYSRKYQLTEDTIYISGWRSKLLFIFHNKLPFHDIDGLALLLLEIKCTILR